MKTQRGLLASIEGGEGVGKSTQIARLRNKLERLNIDCLFVREPGGTNVGERIRGLLLDPAIENFSPRAELMLYGAGRAQIVDEVIEPALAAGKNVICDRFYDSTTAYQGFGRDLDKGFVAAMNRFATAGLKPELTIYLYMDPLVALKRATSSGADRIEKEAIEFHQRVLEGFLWIASKEPERFKMIDASGSPDEVEALMWDYLGPFFMRGR